MSDPLRLRFNQDRVVLAGPDDAPCIAGPVARNARRGFNIVTVVLESAVSLDRRVFHMLIREPKTMSMRRWWPGGP